MFSNGTIRVLSPKTVDGNRPKIGADGRIEYKEEFLPITAKRPLERQNNRLPDHLKKKIEVVSNGDIKPVAIQSAATETVVKKRGPKPKDHA